MLEVDEEALFEEDLDNRVDLEDEVDEDVLERASTTWSTTATGTGTTTTPATGPTPAAGSAVSIVALVVGDATDVEDLEIEDLEDREESLDRILGEKLAGDEEPGDDPDEGDDLVTVATTGTNRMVGADVWPP